jgi:hypothetical protein
MVCRCSPRQAGSVLKAAAASCLRLRAGKNRNFRRFRALRAAGATFAEIGCECGCDWRTVRKYLAEDTPVVPPSAPSRMGTQPLLISPFIPLVEAWLRAALRITGTVVHERLVAEYGFAKGMASI